MSPKFPTFLRGRMGVFAVIAGVAGSIVSGFAGEVSSSSESSTTPPPESRVAAILDKFLPTAWQKRPTVQYNVFTELTPEGKKARVPSPEKPMYYFANPARFALTGWGIES